MSNERFATAFVIIALAFVFATACKTHVDETGTATPTPHAESSSTPTPIAPEINAPSPPKPDPLTPKPIASPSAERTLETSPTADRGIGSGTGGTGPGNGGGPIDNPNPIRTNPVDYNAVFSGREVDRKPRILQKPEPRYTDAARRDQITGTVILNVVLAANGQVTDIKIVNGLADGLNEATIEAARRLKFTPAMINGRPVSMYMQLQYNFNLY